MRVKSQEYFNRLKTMYTEYEDNDSLLALAEIEQIEERARTLAIYREQPKTQELIEAALGRYRTCLEKLTRREIAMKMTPEERGYCFAALDWALFTLDIVGETPERAESQIDEMVMGYAKKAGIA